jgi:PBP1b-binding outer membrane lipoprotein LpoB
MKSKKILSILLIGVFLLTACSNNGNTSEKKSTAKENQTETKPTKKEVIDTELVKPSLKEAANIPASDKKALLAVVNQYIKAFNDENLDAYMKTISKNPTSFQYEDEKTYTKKVFETMNMHMVPTKLVIIDYKPTEANVYMEMKTTISEKGTQKKVLKNSRQISTYRKENGEWKMISTQAMETK